MTDALRGDIQEAMVRYGTRVRFFCARTMIDVRDQVLRVLAREGRISRLSPPAA